MPIVQSKMPILHKSGQPFNKLNHTADVGNVATTWFSLIYEAQQEKGWNLLLSAGCWVWILTMAGVNCINLCPTIQQRRAIIASLLGRVMEAENA